MTAAGGGVRKDIVLIGGGHSHVEVLRRFGMKPVPGLRLTLIAKDVHTPYSGMLPGFVAGHYAFDDIHIDLGPLSRFARARLIRDEAVGLDLEGRRVHCLGRPPLAYDILSIDIGSTPGMADVPGATGRAVPVKPIAGFVRHWQRLAERVLANEHPLRIGVVGAGAGGVEILLCVQYRLNRLLTEQKHPADRLSYHLVSGTPELLPEHNARTRAKLARVLSERGVHCHMGKRVDAVEAKGVRLEDGRVVELDEILWVTSASAAPWIAGSGLATDSKGFVLVDDALQSVSHPGVFAAGDIAAMTHHPRPKSGVFAVRQGPPLAQNLRRSALGRPLQRFRPQAQYLSIITTGNQYAVASRGGWAGEGKLVWRWKDVIDRRFMRRYNDLPEMSDGKAAARDDQADAMRCGGCGAKVGSTTLRRALSRLEPQTGEGILSGLDLTGDAAVVQVPPGKVALQTVDFFRAFIDDPYVFGQIAANHALGDIFAMGGEPQTALAIVTVPPEPSDKVEEEVFQMLAGGLAVLHANGAVLVGGHTGEGAERALGFAVHGIGDQARLLAKAGMQPGDRLVLTKPLGTGTLLAADMRGKAKGRWIGGALESMLQSSRQAARCLREHGARACTDVTGFGLARHLLDMAQSSNVDVQLHLGALPILKGARETAGMSFLSTLHPENARSANDLRDGDAMSTHDVWPLLFDPQTAGGLLASVPDDRAEPCIAELQHLGYRAASLIGTVLPRSNHPAPIMVVP